LQDPEGVEVSEPEAYRYECHSGGSVEMPTKFHDELIDVHTELEKEEINSKHAHERLGQGIPTQVDQATQGREKKSESKAEHLQKKADAEGDLQDTTTTKDDEKHRRNMRNASSGSCAPWSPSPARS